jgi:hypothetical protein
MDYKSECVHWFPIQEEDHLHYIRGMCNADTFTTHLRKVAGFIPAIFIATDVSAFVPIYIASAHSKLA